MGRGRGGGEVRGIGGFWDLDLGPGKSTSLNVTTIVGRFTGHVLTFLVEMQRGIAQWRAAISSKINAVLYNFTYFNFCCAWSSLLHGFSSRGNQGLLSSCCV